MLDGVKCGRVLDSKFQTAALACFEALVYLSLSQSLNLCFHMEED